MSATKQQGYQPVTLAPTQIPGITLPSVPASASAEENGSCLSTTWSPSHVYRTSNSPSGSGNASPSFNSKLTQPTSPTLLITPAADNISSSHSTVYEKVSFSGTSNCEKEFSIQTSSVISAPASPFTLHQQLSPPSSQFLMEPVIDVDCNSSGSKDQRRTWERFFTRPLQRSRSAGSRSDVPAHALFLSQDCKQANAQKLKKSDDNFMTSDFLFNDDKCKKNKKKSALDMKDLFGFFHRKSSADLCNDQPLSKSGQPSAEQIQKWATSFETLLNDRYGLSLFHAFLRTEYSEENIQFWMACESYRNIHGVKKMNKEAQRIYREFLSVQAPREVNLDSKTRLQTIASLGCPNKLTFDVAQKRIQALMEKDSYQRFLRSDFYPSLSKTGTPDLSRGRLPSSKAPAVQSMSSAGNGPGGTTSRESLSPARSVSPDKYSL